MVPYNLPCLLLQLGRGKSRVIVADTAFDPTDRQDRAIPRQRGDLLRRGPGHRRLFGLYVPDLDVPLARADSEDVGLRDAPALERADVAPLLRELAQLRDVRVEISRDILVMYAISARKIRDIGSRTRQDTR